MPLKQSLCYPMVANKGLDADSIFQQAAATGYQAAEFHFRNDETPALIDQAHAHGLTIASMCGHRSIASGLNDPAEHPRIEQELAESIDFAVEHGVRSLICFSGNRLPHLDDDAAIENCSAALNRVLPYAERHGVQLVMELLNSKVDHAGYQADNTAWGVRLCERVDHPHFRLLYDIYHMQIMEGDIIRTIRENLRWIGHIHTAGNPGRFDLDDQQELNYRAIAHALDEAGYADFVSHEFSPKGEPMEAMAAAFSLFRDS